MFKNTFKKTENNKNFKVLFYLSKLKLLITEKLNLWWQKIKIKLNELKISLKNIFQICFDNWEKCWHKCYYIYIYIYMQ